MELHLVYVDLVIFLIEHSVKNNLDVPQNTSAEISKEQIIKVY